MMKRLRCANTVITIACLTALCAFETEAAPVDPETEDTRHLSKFGYVPPVNSDGRGIASEDAIPRVITEYHLFMGINVTGNTDVGTAHVVTLPKCGIRDIVRSGTGGRSKRHAPKGSKWPRNNLTYRVSRYSKSLDRTEVDRDIARAFAVWSDHSKLTFSPSTGKIDIEIRFEHGNHGDKHPFDKSSFSSIAHAFAPTQEGEIHFNEDLNWTTDRYHGFNFFQTAVHVIGHSLGLGDSDVQSSVMYPIVPLYNPDFKLDSVDIEAIQVLYGSKMEDPLKICEDPKVDAMLTTADGDIFAFKGNYYWELKTNEEAAENPKLISEKWKGLPGNIDTAFTYKVWTYFFKGSKYWRYGNVQIDEEPFTGYISQGFPGIPDDLDAAIVWTGDEKLYFFKGDQFWRFDGGQKAHPESISEWEGLPNNLDAAVVYKGYTFFFKDDVHYRFNDDTLSVDRAKPPFPRPNGGWFDCPYPNK